MRTTILAAAVAMLAAGHAASAADLFTIDGTVTSTVSQSRHLGFSRAEDALDAVKGSNLHSYFSNYSGTEITVMHMDYRGLEMHLGYVAPGSTALLFDVPSLGIEQTFNGATRDESQRLYADFMKKSGGDLLSRIQKKLVEVSPSDPIAGNPNSLMGRMVSNDFATAFNDVASDIGTRDGKASGVAGIGLQYASLRQNGIDNRNITLPLSYTVRNDIDPRRQLIFNLPLSYSDVAGAQGYGAGFGVAYRLPMNDSWSLTPALNYGVAVSRDQGAVGQAVSGSLASTYVWRRSNFDVALGNMLGYYRTLKLSAGGYSYDPGIANTVLRNGVMLSQPVNVMGRKMSLEYSLIDTKFFGSALYDMHYDEIGVTLGTNKRASSARSFMRAGVSYLHSPKTNGLMLNLGYWF
jgi:hypothetical protein